MRMLALALSAAAITSARAQETADRDRWADSARAAIERSVTRGDDAGLRAGGALLERALVAFPDDPLLLHYLGYARYREANLLLGRQGEGKEVRALLEAADSLLERSARRLQLPETHALRSSVLGQMIGSNPLRGMTLGPRSSGAMDRALELGPRNPRVWLLRGISAMFTPKMFGGGLDKAEAYLTKAAELFAADRPAPHAPDWGRAEVYAWLGQVHQRQGRTGEARAAFNRALEIEPEYGWVRYVLLPALDRAGG